jgi:SAM-dependent methyltransferase
MTLTTETLDWNRLWREDRAPKRRANDREFWNRRAPSFANHVLEDDYDDYVDPFLRMLAAPPQWSVLDVGCGAGTLAHPLAKAGHKITAIDFAPGMIELLENRSKAEGIGNITTRLASWDDDWSALGVEPHDVAIASRSLISDDPRRLLEKLMAFARKRVCISCAVGDGPFDRRIFEAVGRKLERNPDYLYVYNLLHQMGIYANVFIIEKRRRSFAGEEEAVESVRWMLEEISPDEEAALRRFIAAHLVADGYRWRIDYEEPVRWAAIRWDV